MDKKQYSLLGLMQRAGALITGEELVVKAVQSNKAKLVVLAEDASANTEKKISDKCRYYNIPLYRLGSRDDLGAAVGKERRVVIAVTDTGFADAYQKNEKKRV
ncbi:hypothetical protein C6Y45_04690 [Alkalicoccus saliphilus]|jgi:ribosomal protein L7Ae-like RNA K-turn-binding protein|uniref:Ribosomal protein eL8/eL30/eS12/Gadd45 domain-containing protein n=2 Tax=Alkalicoccus saliphilus TaxID=200989 RepID=A0A2T4U8B4_9BACI|nr:YlxQ family RNA-binding protein [Alkalicoccus saliphilus]PTL39620.1 hypothetical protein C6Y45_04690 [Alkalicoccus saliphilus]